MKKYDLETQFTILHHSARYKETTKQTSNWTFIDYNLVFTAQNSTFKKMCHELCSEWVEKIYVQDKNVAEKYFDGLETRRDENTGEWVSYNEEGLKRDDIFFRGWEHQFPHFVYNEKFDTFQFRDYLQDNPVTRGIITYIDNLKDRIVYGHCEPFSAFYSCLNNLQYWWD